MKRLQRRMPTCAHCRFPLRGKEIARGPRNEPLCNPHPWRPGGCYQLVAVEKHAMPCWDCQFAWELETYSNNLHNAYSLGAALAVDGYCKGRCVDCMSAKILYAEEPQWREDFDSGMAEQLQWLRAKAVRRKYRPKRRHW